MKSERLIGVEWLRGIAAFGIVGCHLCLNNMTSGALWLQSFTDLNVGVFAMLAGLFFLPQCSRFDSWQTYVHLRSFRLLIPYAFWSVIYVGIDVVFDILAKKALSFQPTRWDYWVSITFKGGGAAHLWFLIALFYVQVLLYSIFKKLRIVIDGKWLAFVSAAMGLCCVALCGDFGNWYRFYLSRLLGFFLMGVACSLMVEKIRQIPLVVWGGAALAGSCLIGSGWNYGKIGECVLSVPLVLFAICWNPQAGKISHIGMWLGKTSFGVYLVHVLFAVAVRFILVRFSNASNALVFILDQVCVWSVSVAFVWGISRVTTRFSILKFILP